MSTEIFYWDGLIMDETIADKYVEVIKQLKNGELQGAGLSLKKMRSHRVFSLSTSYSGRLLFTSRIINQKKCLIFLEELPNHDYKNSKFLNNPATLNQFLEKNNDEFMNVVDFDEEFMDIDDFPDAMDIDVKEKRLYTPVEYYDQEFIVLNSAQKGAKFAKGPAVIEGPPGSGKSCAALSLIANARPELNKILYLTTSPALVDHMRNLYKSLPSSLESPPGRVVFKSYLQLVHETDPSSIDKKIVGQKHFAKWFAEYCDKKEQQLKTQKKDLGNSKKKRTQKEVHQLPQELLDIENVYQEFRTTAAYADYSDTKYDTNKKYTQAKYEELGEKHQSLSKKQHRSWIYQAYQDYITYLNHTNRLDLSFYRLKSNEEYDMVVVDEGQDFSKAQIQDITTLTSPAMQLYFCRDSHQSLEDCQSSGPFIHEHLYRIGKKIGIKSQHIELPCSYRVFPNAQLLVARILDLRLKLIGGRADKLEYVQLPLTVEQNSTLGSVHWFDKVPEKVRIDLQQATQSSDLAIITLPEFVEEAKKFFKTDLVYTVDQIKGLQFPVVVLYRMAEDKALEDANKLLQRPEYSYIGSSSSTNRPAEGVGNPKFGPPINRFFTAATRAQQQIIVIQPQQHKFNQVINAIKSIEQSNEEFKIELNKQSYTEEKWLDFVKKLIRKNDIPLAKKIFIQHLKKTPDEFKELLTDSTKPNVISLPKSVVTPEQTAASNSYTAPSEAIAGSIISTIGLFAPASTRKRTNQQRKKNAPRHQQNSNRVMAKQIKGTTTALSVTRSAKSSNKSKKTPPPQIQKPVPQHNIAKAPADKIETQNYSMAKVAKVASRIKCSPNPGLHLSDELSKGSMDIHEMNCLFIYFPELNKLITLDQLCKPVDGNHTSLLSQLCSPYDVSRQTFLHLFFETNPELLNVLTDCLTGYFLSLKRNQAEHVSELTSTLWNFIKEKTVDCLDLRYLNTTEPGKKLFLELANKLDWSTERLQQELENAADKELEPNFPAPFQRQNIDSTAHKLDLFAAQLNELNEASWSKIISINKTDDTLRKIVRLMIQGNRIGAELWKSVPFISLLDFFNYAYSESKTHLYIDENDSELITRIITTFDSNPDWNIIEQLNYIDLELCSPDLNLTSNFAGILRIVRNHLLLENRLLNKLYVQNIKFWDNTVKQFGEAFTNTHRVNHILDQLASQDAIAIKAWQSLQISDEEFKNNSSVYSLQFFTACKNEMPPDEFNKCSLLQEILFHLSGNEPWDLKASFDYISKWLQSTRLERFGLLAGFLRFSHHYLSNQLLQEKMAQIRFRGTPILISERTVPDHNNLRSGGDDSISGTENGQASEIGEFSCRP